MDARLLDHVGEPDFDEQRMLNAGFVMDSTSLAEPCHPYSISPSLPAVDVAHLIESHQSLPAAATGTAVQHHQLTEKRCYQCNVVSNVSAFRRTSNHSDGLSIRCKGCELALGRGVKRDPDGRPREVKVASKFCLRCSTIKPFADFFISKSSLDGLTTYCRSCQSTISSASRKKRMATAAEHHEACPSEKTVNPIVSSKKCSLCSEEKPATDYFKSTSSKDGLYSYCKGCSAAKNRESKRRKRKKAAAAQETEEGVAVHHEEDSCRALVVDHGAEMAGNAFADGDVFAGAGGDCGGSGGNGGADAEQYMHHLYGSGHPSAVGDEAGDFIHASSFFEACVSHEQPGNLFRD